MLAAAYRAGKLPHALLFAGPHGIGKATLAFHLRLPSAAHPSHGRRAPHELAAPDPTSPLFRQIADRRASLGAASDAAVQRKDQDASRPS